MGFESSSKIESPLGPVPSGWKLVRVKDVARKVGSGATPKGGESVYLAARHRVALIRSQNVFDRRFSTEGLAFISDHHAEELSGAAVQVGDVLLNITGDGVTFGRSCLVPDFVLPACVNQHVSIIRLDAEKCSPGYLLSYLTHPTVKDYIESFNAGGSRRAVTKGHIESFEIPLPPLSVQESIAQLLAGFDDKIERNRRMNCTLEAMARAIFQSWFVDFDPVRAKMDGRAPIGMGPATAALFPDHFEDSELGKIPAGWTVCEIRELTSAIQYGLTQSATQNPIGPQFLRITDIRGGNIDWQQVPYCSVDEADYAKYQVGPGDVFVARTGASTGENVYIVDCPKAVFASYLVRFKFQHKSLARYIGQYMRTDEYFTFVSGIIGGSAQPNANAQQLASARLVVPPHTICNLFYELVETLDKKRYANEVESRTLAALRDTLLPKLISGELRVPEAERLVGTAT